MNILSYILWSPVPEIFPNVEWGIIGNIRWYGLLFAMAFIVGQQVMSYIFKVEGKPDRDIETLTIFIVVATVLGARLGHVFFYEPARFLADPLEIIMINKGGLASHGAAFGIILGIYIYSNYLIRIGFSKPRFVLKKKKREGQSFLWVIDRIVIVVAIGGCFIRMGNFINSEIIGKPSDNNLAVFFARNVIESFENDQNIDEVTIERDESGDNQNLLYPVKIIFTFENKDYQEAQIKSYLNRNIKNVLSNYEYVKQHINEPTDTPLKYSLSQTPAGVYQATVFTSAIPRHPTQVYESLTSLLIAILLFWMWSLKKAETPEGRLFGLFLILLFGLRFFHELFKENQVDFENSMTMNMGQLLSIPLILAGIYVFARSFKKQTPETD